MPLTKERERDRWTHNLSPRNSTKLPGRGIKLKDPRRNLGPWNEYRSWAHIPVVMAIAHASQSNDFHDQSTTGRGVTFIVARTVRKVGDSCSHGLEAALRPNCSATRSFRKQMSPAAAREKSSGTFFFGSVTRCFRLLSSWGNHLDVIIE